MTTTEPEVPGRTARYSDLVPPDKLAAAHAVVIGVGAVGRQVALQLAAIGVGALSLFDHDTVEGVNLGTQGYFPEDLGEYKVNATRDLCRRKNPDLKLKAYARKFISGDPGGWADGAAVFCCVDSMDARREIWAAVKEKASFYADSRMSGEVIHAFSVDDPARDLYYETTLFPESERVQERCTARGTLGAASALAGILVTQWGKSLRGAPAQSDVLINLTSMELFVTRR